MAIAEGNFNPGWWSRDTFRNRAARAAASKTSMFPTWCHRDTARAALVTYSTVEDEPEPPPQAAHTSLVVGRSTLQDVVAEVCLQRLLLSGGVKPAKVQQALPMIARGPRR